MGGTSLARWRPVVASLPSKPFSLSERGYGCGHPHYSVGSGSVAVAQPTPLQSPRIGLTANVAKAASRGPPAPQVPHTCVRPPPPPTRPMDGAPPPLLCDEAVRLHERGAPRGDARRFGGGASHARGAATPVRPWQQVPPGGAPHPGGALRSESSWGGAERGGRSEPPLRASCHWYRSLRLPWFPLRVRVFVNRGNGRRC